MSGRWAPHLLREPTVFHLSANLFSTSDSKSWTGNSSDLSSVGGVQLAYIRFRSSGDGHELLEGDGHG